MHKNIYLAGPYSADSLIQAMRHIRAGQRASRALLVAGFNIHCPWLDYQLLMFGDITVADFQRNSLSFLTYWADLMIVMPGWFNSRGTRAEMESAFQKEVPVYDHDSSFVVEELGLGIGWWE